MKLKVYIYFRNQAIRIEEDLEMTSVQDFEVGLRACVGDIDDGTSKDVVTIVKQVVENSNRDMAMSIITSTKFVHRCVS